jgi:WD40 repeat protein
VIDRSTHTPVQLTSGPVNFLGPCPSADGKGLFVNGHQPRGELMRYDRTLNQLVPYLSGISAEGLDFSRDGRWVTYVSYPESALWRSQGDGNQRLRLTPPGMEAALPHWSPDGGRIAFSGSLRKGPWKSYVVSAGGADSPRPIIGGNGPEFDPNWSPDGKALVYADSIVSPVPMIHEVDMKTGHVATLPGSEHMFSPRWSPDGRFIAAVPTDSIGLNVFDRARGTWSHLLKGRHVSYPSWSSDSAFLNFCSLMEVESGFYRVRVANGEVQKLADIPGRLAPGSTGWWTGFTPDGSPLLLRDVGIEEIYLLAVKW